ncbi:MAG TPA: ATP-binding cassette domain-containing protein [Spirochaetota bacterium]|nr:ATP-binding cassette domain-containing protein [Spirochaetota bacterium]HPI90344.1 ATP-binding cassette domain-containing protein [Spirochaetota bacterium]HPR49433.1 ATP-binding cassette domain-containing protein [Spirochaetota bacterium]
MIDVRGLSVSFDRKPVIRGIDLHLNRGDSLVLLGKNGSGKSVILKCIAGLIAEFEGEITINGRDVRSTFQSRDISLKKADGDVHLAYVFQKGGLFDSMNVYENVAFGLRRMGIAPEEIERKVAGSLKRVGLAGSEEKLPSELSGGMQKRVGLARAVCMDPDIILFDDPTAGLDPVLSDSIADLMIEIRDSLKTTSIIVTHDLKVAEKVADSMALLYDGKIVFSGAGSDFFTQTDPYARQFIEGDVQGPIDIL